MSSLHTALTGWQEAQNDEAPRRDAGTSLRIAYRPPPP
jgi:hypothetical protein